MRVSWNIPIGTCLGKADAIDSERIKTRESAFILLLSFWHRYIHDDNLKELLVALSRGVEGNRLVLSMGYLGVRLCLLVLIDFYKQQLNISPNFAACSA